MTNEQVSDIRNKLVIFDALDLELRETQSKIRLLKSTDSSRGDIFKVLINNSGGKDLCVEEKGLAFSKFSGRDLVNTHIACNSLISNAITKCKKEILESYEIYAKYLEDKIAALEI